MALEDLISYLEPYLVPDHEFDRAYEEVSPYVRGLIKKSISLNYLWFEYFFRGPCNYFFKGNIKEIDFSINNEPKQLALLVLSKDIDSFAELIPLVIAPRLLDIEVVVVGNFDTWPINLILTLELLGISNVYLLPSEDRLSNLAGLTTDRESTFLFLGECTYLDKSNFKNRDIFFFYPPKQGMIIEDPKKSKVLDINHIKSAHPSMAISKTYLKNEIESINDVLKEVVVDVIYLPLEYFFESMSQTSPLILGPGFETFWVWDRLYRQIFFNITCSFFEFCRKA